MSYSICSKCGQHTLLSSERVDQCYNPDCGFYSYYPDAYISGDTYKEGYEPVDSDE